MFSSFFDDVSHRRVEPFGSDRRFQLQVGEAMCAREPFDFANDGGKRRPRR
jgi:hypothetical protein